MLPRNTSHRSSKAFWERAKSHLQVEDCQHGNAAQIKRSEQEAASSDQRGGLVSTREGNDEI